jgi:predicted transcriptional regulator
MMSAPSAFETILAASSDDVALEAGYNALRVLRHRHYAGGYLRGLQTRPATAVDETTARLITAIETHERRPVDQLDDRRAERYIVDLARLVVDRATRNTAHLGMDGRTVLERLRQDHIPGTARPQSAVPIDGSVGRDRITCLICGHQQKVLKRHLAVAHRLTPAEYRRLFELPADYPMVAPSYHRQRAEIARRIGFGRPRKTAARRPANPAKSTAK